MYLPTNGCLQKEASDNANSDGYEWRTDGALPSNDLTNTTFHSVMLWLKAAALENMNIMFETAATFHAPIGRSNADASLNM